MTDGDHLVYDPEAPGFLTEAVVDGIPSYRYRPDSGAGTVWARQIFQIKQPTGRGCVDGQCAPNCYFYTDGFRWESGWTVDENAWLRHGEVLDVKET